MQKAATAMVAAFSLYMEKEKGLSQMTESFWCG